MTEIGFSWNLYHFAAPTCVVVRCPVRAAHRPAEVARGDFEGRGPRPRGGRPARRHPDRRHHGIEHRRAPEDGSGGCTRRSRSPGRRSTVYVPSAPSQLGRLLASIDQTLANLEKFDVAKLTGNLNHAISSAATALQRLGQLDVKGISQNANQAIREASGAIQEIRGLAQDARRDLQSMKLDAVGSDASHLLNNLDARLQALIDKLSGIDVRALNDTLAGHARGRAQSERGARGAEEVPVGIPVRRRPAAARGPAEGEEVMGARPMRPRASGRGRDGAARPGGRRLRREAGARRRFLHDRPSAARLDHRGGRRAPSRSRAPCPSRRPTRAGCSSTAPAIIASRRTPTPSSPRLRDGSSRRPSAATFRLRFRSGRRRSGRELHADARIEAEVLDLYGDLATGRRGGSDDAVPRREDGRAAPRRSGCAGPTRSGSRSRSARRPPSWTAGAGRSARSWRSSSPI